MLISRNGFYVIKHLKMADIFLEKLPIEKFYGIEKVTAEKMKAKGIFTGIELKQISKKNLVKWFGKAGNYYFDVVRGIDNRQVNPNRIRKSLGAEELLNRI